MANRRPGGLRQRKKFRVGDGDVPTLAKPFFEVPHFLSMLPLVAKSRGFDPAQAKEIAHWLAILHECSPTTWRFVKDIIAHAYPGTRLDYKPMLEGNKSLSRGLEMLDYVEHQQAAALVANKTPLTINDIVDSIRFQKRFLDGHGNARTQRKGRPMTAEWAKKQMRKARSFRDADKSV